MGVLNLAELGISTALTYILFKPLHRKENSELRQLYFIIKKIYHFIALGILVIGLLFFLLLNSIVNASISPENLYITWGVCYKYIIIIFILCSICHFNSRPECLFG